MCQRYIPLTKESALTRHSHLLTSRFLLCLSQVSCSNYVLEFLGFSYFQKLQSVFLDLPDLKPATSESLDSVGLPNLILLLLQSLLISFLLPIL